MIFTTNPELNAEKLVFCSDLSLLKMREMRYSLIPALKRAKELNQDYLPNYSELGKIYSEIGKYELAEQEFIIALSEEKFPNYRHKMYTLQDRAI